MSSETLLSPNSSLATHLTRLGLGKEPADRHKPLQAWAGDLTFSHVRGRTALDRSYARYPLKFISPSASSVDCTWVYLIGYGGGLLSGDEVAIRCALGPHTTAALSTQGTTKVYKRRRSEATSSDGEVVEGVVLAGASSSQRLSCTVADGALLAVVPEPVTCFTDACYTQTQEFKLAAGGSLVFVDAFTSGRMQRGEAWAFHRFESRNTVYVDGELVFYDPLVLEDASSSAATAAQQGDRADGAASGPSGPVLPSLRERMRGMNAIALALFVGPRVSAATEALLAGEGRDGFESHAAASIARGKCKPASSGNGGSGGSDGVSRGRVLTSLSALRGGNGFVLRVAAERTEDLYASLRAALAPLKPVLGFEGDGPFAR